MNRQEPQEGTSPPASNSVWSCPAGLSFELKIPINTMTSISTAWQGFLQSEREGQAGGIGGQGGEAGTSNVLSSPDTSILARDTNQGHPANC